MLGVMLVYMNHLPPHQLWGLSRADFALLLCFISRNCVFSVMNRDLPPRLLHGVLLVSATVLIISELASPKVHLLFIKRDLSSDSLLNITAIYRGYHLNNDKLAMLPLTRLDTLIIVRFRLVNFLQGHHSNRRPRAGLPCDAATCTVDYDQTRTRVGCMWSPTGSVGTVYAYHDSISARSTGQVQGVVLPPVRAAP